MHRLLKAALVAAVALSTLQAQAPTSSPLLSKRLEFRHGVTLELAENAGGGLRVDTVEFRMPAIGKDGYLSRTAGLLTASVAVSNTSDVARGVGLAIALHDDAGRLLGVASGGNKLTPIKPGRQKTFTLIFDGVNHEAHRATRFEISVEPKR